MTYKVIKLKVVAENLSRDEAIKVKEEFIDDNDSKDITYSILECDK